MRVARMHGARHASAQRPRRIEVEGLRQFEGHDTLRGDERVVQASPFTDAFTRRGDFVPLRLSS